MIESLFIGSILGLLAIEYIFDKHKLRRIESEQDQRINQFRCISLLKDVSEKDIPNDSLLVTYKNKSHIIPASDANDIFDRNMSSWVLEHHKTHYIACILSRHGATCYGIYRKQ